MARIPTQDSVRRRLILTRATADGSLFRFDYANRLVHMQDVLPPDAEITDAEITPQ